MPPSDASDLRRFLALLQRADDSTSADVERQKARTAAGELFASSAAVRDFMRAKAAAAAADPAPSVAPPASRPPAPFPVWRKWIADAATDVFPFVLTNLSADLHSFIDNLVNQDFTMSKTPVTRMNIADLLHECEIGARTFTNADDVPIVVCTISVPESILAEMARRLNHGEGAGLTTKLGRLSIETLVEAAEDGDAGDFAFADDADDDADADD